jgi:hypothetical protein
MDTSSLIIILQTSMAPCVLISGVGLLLLSMTNRLGRPLDRIRLLTIELRQVPEDQRKIIREEMDVLLGRAKQLQTAIVFATISIIFVAIMIIALFVAATYSFALENLIQILFSASLICLVISLLLFLNDIRQSLNSIKIELERWTEK